MRAIIDSLLHLDEKVFSVIRDYGTQAYFIFFLIIFAETGLVVMPFLPGDSLLFALGMFSNPKEAALNVWILIPLLTTAAVIGDNLNYQIGKRVGARALEKGDSKFIRREQIEKTQEFFDKHGGMTLVLARWVPVVRTFAPFVAGMGSMPYFVFLRWSIVGGALWVSLCTLAGYFFGQIPIVKENFEIAMLSVVVLSLIPAAIKLRSATKPKA